MSHTVLVRDKCILLSVDSYKRRFVLTYKKKSSSEWCGKLGSNLVGYFSIPISKEESRKTEFFNFQTVDSKQSDHFNYFYLSTYYVPSTVAAPEGTLVNETDVVHVT